MKFIVSILIYLAFPLFSFSQLTGTVTDPKGKAIVSATALLLRAADTLVVKQSTTNERGFFKVSPPGNEHFLLTIEAPGYEKWTSGILKISDSLLSKDLGTIVLKEISQLNEVVVKTRKPLIRREEGGISVNVQNSLLSKGSSVLEVLSRSPGVSIDAQNGAISLNGKSGVMVMLDGKLLRLTGSQLQALLDGMSANEIEKIELLDTPPAKYDADGNGGLINIITRKAKSEGEAISAVTTAGYGKAGKGSASFDFDRRDKKFDLHAGYAYYHNEGYSMLRAEGTENVGVIGGQTTFRYNGLGKPVSDYHVMNVGIEIPVTPKVKIGGSIYYVFGRNHSRNYNDGYYALQPDSVLVFRSAIDGVNRSRNLIHNLFLQNIISKDEKLESNVDYINYSSSGPSTIKSAFMDNYGNAAGVGDTLYAPEQQNSFRTRIDIAVFKMDYSRQITPNSKLEAGFKTSYTTTNTQSAIDNAAAPIAALSNRLNTQEEIAALYATFATKLDSLTTLTTGFRYEYSHNSTSEISYGPDRKLGKLFPSLFINRKLNDQTNVGLSYTERIGRPSFGDLGSYVSYNDPISVFTGNPALKPTITRNLKASLSWRQYIFSIVASRDENVILHTQITTGPINGLVYLSPQNAPWQNNLTLQAIVPVKFSDWWTSTYSFTGSCRKYKIDYTPERFTASFADFSINFNETFTLPKKVSLECSGYYNSASYYGNSKSGSFGVINLGLKKEFPKTYGSLQFTVSDIARSDRHSSYIGHFTTDAFNTQAVAKYNPESVSVPVFRLTYIWSFGSSKPKANAEPVSADERNRI
jgi:outer membrane receptor protein involved in Fe transport